MYNNGNTSNTNNSYGALSDIRLKENIEPIRDYQEDFMKIQFKKYNLKKIQMKNKLVLLHKILKKYFHH